MEAGNKTRLNFLIIKRNSRANFSFAIFLTLITFVLAVETFLFSVLCKAVTVACSFSSPSPPRRRASLPVSSYLLKPVTRPTQSPVTSPRETVAAFFLKEFHNITRNTQSKSGTNSFPSHRKFQRTCPLQFNYSNNYFTYIYKHNWGTR
jgi:hypothetical protein